VAELVDEEQKDEADGEAPTPDPCVGGDGDEHRRRRREDLQLEEGQDDRLELEDQEPDGGDRRPELPHEVAERPAGLNRLVVAVAVLVAVLGGIELVRARFRLLLRSEAAHRLIVAVPRQMKASPKRGFHRWNREV
jgi:hypothetical protein